MSQQEGEYRVGRGKPPLHTRFRKGRSGNPGGPRRKDLPALNEAVTVDKDGRRRRISKREAIVEGLVDKSAGADLSATKLLIDLLKDIEKKRPSHFVGAPVAELRLRSAGGSPRASGGRAVGDRGRSLCGPMAGDGHSPLRAFPGLASVSCRTTTRGLRVR